MNFEKMKVLRFQLVESNFPNLEIQNTKFVKKIFKIFFLTEHVVNIPIFEILTTF